MGKRKITCKNTDCKHHTTDDHCDTFISISASGKCASYEHGFAYYFHKVWAAMSHSNFISVNDLYHDPDLRIGLFYVMQVFNLCFINYTYGTWRMIFLVGIENESNKGLTYENIVARPLLIFLNIKRDGYAPSLFCLIISKLNIYYFVYKYPITPTLITPLRKKDILIFTGVN